MKKLSLILGFASMACMAFGQNVATVTETGDGNTSYIDQLGSNNSALITQIGDKNSANFSDNHASSLFGLLDGTKGITQHGSGNKGTIDQENLLADPNVVEAGPIAGIGQYGDRNTSTITQKHNSKWMQEYAWAKQVGSDNTSSQYQQSMFGYSHVYQYGNWNTAETQQFGAYGHTASILQIGNGNTATQYQGKSSLAYTEQDNAEATQNGDGNKSYQTQDGSKNQSKLVQQGSNNYSAIHQYTNENVANLNQTGSWLVATIDQYTGDKNVVNLNQTGGIVDIDQNGDNNVVRGLQTPSIDIWATFAGSTLNVMQTGSGNTLDLQSASPGAVVSVNQNGITNTSVVIQN